MKRTIHKHYQAVTGYQNFSHWPSHIETDKSFVETTVGLAAHWKTQMQRGKRRSFESQNGEWAETNARVLQTTPQRVLWQLDPVTGKPHQLRFELSRRGFPILGDKLYGSQESFTGPDFAALALRAVSLNLSDIENRLGLPERFDIEGFSIH